LTVRIDDMLGFVVSRAAYVLRRAAQEVLHEHGFDITVEEYVFLRRLWQDDGLRQGDLARYTIRDRTTVTRLVDGLVRKGFVRREQDGEDRRVVRTWLTPAGRELESVLIPIEERRRSVVLQGVSAEDYRIVTETLRKVQRNVLES
jgi:DNA-binding MarR family transcriptional regulator